MDFWTIFYNVFDITMILLVGYNTVRTLYLKRFTTTMPAVFFAFAAGTILAGDVYWHAHLVINDLESPEFSAAEIAFAGAFMLLGSTIIAAFQTYDIKIKYTVPGMIFGIAFVTANTLWWVGWNGGWLKDIITGVGVAFLVCTCIGAIMTLNMFSKKILITVTAAFVLLCVAETGTLFVSGIAVIILDIIRYIIWAGLLVFFVVKAVIFLVQKKEPESITVSITAYMIAVLIMYLSTDTIYMIANAVYNLIFLLVMLGVKQLHDEKEVQSV